MTVPYATVSTNRWWASLRQVLLHMCTTMLAIGIALSLPVGAGYILYQWWPVVADDTNLLIATEIVLATVLVLLFNAALIAWENRRKVRMADLSALVHVRQNDSWIARWRERRLVRHLPAARDSFVLAITGFDTFADENSPLREPLNKTYEIRVMLMNPYAKGAEKRTDALPEDITPESYVQEVESSIAYLARLRTLGKRVSLKFYEHEPFWKLVVLGDHVWVQYCHRGQEVKHEPEYVFALNRKHPRRGFFVPFYMHFLEQWSDPRHADYDFDTGELAYRDASGKVVRRARFGGDEGHESPGFLSPPVAAILSPAANRNAAEQARLQH